MGKDRVQRIWRREGLKVPQKESQFQFPTECAYSERKGGRGWEMVRVYGCARIRRMTCGAMML
jgi:hypothetical protein